MKDLLKLKTNLIGLIGHPIRHTYSHFIHNLALNLTNLNYYYVTFDIDSLNIKGAVEGMRALNFLGFNVTIPYKIKITEYLNHLSEDATITGSVNTVVINEGNLSGYNTDVYGILETLMPYKDDLVNKNFIVFGAGGSSRALIYTFLRYFKPAKIFLVNRTEDRALTIKNIFFEKMRFKDIEILKYDPSELVDYVQNSKLVVNTTSVGMTPDIDDAILSSNKFFNKDQIVFDFIYNPQTTKFLQFASQANAHIINGMDMLIHQAAKSFELWTSQKFPVDEVKNSLLQLLKEEENFKDINVN